MTEELAAVLAAADTVIYDFDGVIADTEPLHMRSYGELIERLGGTLDEGGFRSLIGRKEREIWPQILHRPADIDGLVEERAGIFLELAESGLELDDRTAAMLGCPSPERILISSGNPRVVGRLLQHWRIADRFQEVHALGDSEISKPEQLRRVVAGRRGNGSWRGVLVEDSPAALAEGASLGLTTVGVVHSLNRREDVANADYVVDRAS
jgi:beta-phosphoglucomutase-like phosphatase (HAD superfamily)